MLIEGVISLDADMLSCPFNVTYDGGGVAALVDGDQTTFWHTPYQSDGGYEYYYDEIYGHYFEINIGKQISQIKCRYYNRDNSSDASLSNRWAKDIDIYISNDGNEWEKLESVVAPRTREVELGRSLQMNRSATCGSA
ncbi:MAG: discoidin domain-containing protein [Bacteroidetes bacterium]|uniref:Discoidin domain-containing protein n=1 Tax=Candidatus Cryptobacteroides intestinavium TaxID=2840766 RepID=A0A9D9EQJ6_9BACT|nr:discoidin domain-containing protein [Candidatus Cryptobacteroides intestinavium]